MSEKLAVTIAVIVITAAFGVAKTVAEENLREYFNEQKELDSNDNL